MRNVFTVTELNGQIKDLLETGFDLFWITGEVSNLHRPSSGHIYFTLKDADSQIRAVMFRSSLGKRPFPQTGVRFDLESGMSIVCRARLSVYPPRGEYQLLVDNIEPLGLGALQKAFEQLKARLQAEGLFAPALKKKLPPMPRRIGVITSPTGAVIRDILNITWRRFPSVDILIAPVRVQNIGAAGEIIRALADLQTQKDVDVIILARGGGSLEDLAPFNDEGVARAIFRCPLPVISAIGHETDFTIADFVADLRAPTPSAAAELVVPVLADLAADLAALRTGMIRHQLRLLERLREKLAYTVERLPTPHRRIADLRLTIDERLSRMQRIFDNKRETLKKRLEADMMVLDTLSPFAVLRRGYSITKTLPEGVIVKDTRLLAPGQDVDITLAAGGFRARVREIYGSAD